MTVGSLVTQPVLRAVDANGLPMAGAKLQFYATGGTTPQTVYTTSAINVALANPVIADSGGLFAPIYLDPTLIYRCQLLSSAGTVIRDIDPLNQIFTPLAGSITSGMLAGGVAVANLGFTPLNKAGDTATNLLVQNSALANNSAGYLGVPLNEQDAGPYTLVLADAGKMVRANAVGALTYIIPPIASVAYPLGTAILIRNTSTGTLTIQRGAGVTLWLAGNGTSKDFAMAQWGLATIVQESPNIWVISGTNLT